MNWSRRTLRTVPAGSSTSLPLEPTTAPPPPTSTPMSAPCLPSEDAAQDAAERRADARALLAEAALVDAHHARADVGAAAVRHLDLVERELETAAVRRAARRLDVRDDAADGRARGDDDPAVDPDALGDGGLDPVLAPRGRGRDRLLESHRDLGSVGYRHGSGRRWRRRDRSCARPRCAARSPTAGRPRPRPGTRRGPRGCSDGDDAPACSASSARRAARPSRRRNSAARGLLSLNWLRVSSSRSMSVCRRRMSAPVAPVG